VTSRSASERWKHERREDAAGAPSPAPTEEVQTATGVLLRMQRGVGNHAATQAVESLRGRGRLLQRCFADLQGKLTSSSVSTEVKVVLPESSSKRERLDALWKSNMGATSPEAFVLRAVAGLSDLVEHNRLYVHFDLLGETGVLFEVKFQPAPHARLATDRRDALGPQRCRCHASRHLRSAPAGP